MQCPRCPSSLDPAVYEDVQIHTCEACGGEFIGAQELVRIVQARQQQFGDRLKAEMAGHKPCFGGAADQPQRELRCPACDGPMEVVNYGGDSGVFVDRCGVCGGLWLDHEELEKVQIVMERWADEAPGQLAAIAGELEMARRQAAGATGQAFSGSRFSFINAIVNRLLDAA
jgi:Zn-finger nucleic acid-binding protein